MREKLDGIDWFANEIVRKNMTVAWLINRAKALPACRKNILITKILCWNKHIDLLAYDIISQRECSIFDVNFRCQEFVEEYELANVNFTKFFFDFHEAIANFYLHRMETIIKGDMDIRTKITALFSTYTELMNISRIEVEGFDINCAVIGNNYKCKENICKDQPNVITVMPTPESVGDPSVLEGYVRSFQRITECEKVTVVVDYRNVCMYVDCYNWEGCGAWERYQNALKYVKAVYFYNYGCVNFGKYKEKLKPYFIRTEKQYKQVYTGGGR